MSAAKLVELSRALSDPLVDAAILAEGNASARAGQEAFLIKASGYQMCSLTEQGLTKVTLRPLIDALDRPKLSDDEVDDLLHCVAEGKRPSTESFMHAYLLSLSGVEYVAHTHPTPLLSLLCLPDAEQIARHRLFPDEIVCCGPRACWVEYADPGHSLSVAIRKAVEDFRGEEGELPKTIWLQNHGLICMGRTPEEVLSATQMSVKAARVWLGALQAGKFPLTLTKQQIERIHRRPDEHYRQRLLRQSRTR
jgi:L-ribulose-5-phosphate 4-epimerase